MVLMEEFEGSENENPKQKTILLYFLVEAHTLKKNLILVSIPLHTGRET